MPDYPFLKPTGGVYLQPGVEKFYTAPELPEGWKTDDAGNVTTPEGWKILADGGYITPEGQRITSADIIANAQLQREIESLLPDIDIQEMIGWAEEAPTRFVSEIESLGDNEITRALLGAMGFSDENSDLLLNPPSITQMALERFKEGQDAGSTFKPALGVAGAYLHKYLGRPWQWVAMSLSREVAAMLLHAPIVIPGITPAEPAVLNVDEIQKTAISLIEQGRFNEAKALVQSLNEYQRLSYEETYDDRMSKVTGKYGWGSIFSEETDLLWHEYCGRGKAPRALTIAYEFANPLYFLPLGGAFGVGARVLSKVPVLGKTMKVMAYTVQGLERGIAMPLIWAGKGIKRTALAIRPIERMVAEMNAKQVAFAAERVAVKETETVVMEIPSMERLIMEGRKGNWQKSFLENLTKGKFGKVGKEFVEWFDPSAIYKQGVAKDIAEYALAGLQISGMGRSIAGVAQWILRSIHPNPTKLFGFNKQAISTTVKVAPGFEKVADKTLEDIFVHPFRYVLNDTQKRYIWKVVELEEVAYKLMQREGVNPVRVSEEWYVHRVVQGKMNAEEAIIITRGRGVRGYGGKKGIGMHRKAPTMADGIAWGVIYSRVPEDSVVSYFHHAFDKIAERRVVAGLEHYGTTASEIVAEKFPELIKARTLIEAELVQLRRLNEALKWAEKGAMPHWKTIQAIENVFPRYTKRFKQILRHKIASVEDLQKFIKWQQATIDTYKTAGIKARMAPVEPSVKPAKPPAPVEFVPNEKKLEEAFRIMGYEDRQAFRATMAQQADDLGRIIVDQDQELIGMREFLENDPVAVYRGHVGKQKLSLISLVKQGNFPETVIVKQAQMLKMGKEVSPAVIKKGRVSWEYVMDELADHFHMNEQQLINHMEKIAHFKVTVDDLTRIIASDEARLAEINKLISILSKAEGKPGVISPRPVQPEWGIQSIPATQERVLIRNVDKAQAEALALEYGGIVQPDDLNPGRMKIVEPPGVGEPRPKPLKPEYPELVEDMRKFSTADEWEKYYSKSYGDWHTAEATVKRLNKRFGIKLFGSTRYGLKGDVIVADYGIQNRAWEASRIAKVVTPPMPKAVPGQLEVGLQKDIFGYYHPFTPQGKGEIVQLSIDDYAKLMDARAQKGITTTPENVVIKPKVEGLKGFEGVTEMREISYLPPKGLTDAEIRTQLGAFHKEIEQALKLKKVEVRSIGREYSYRVEVEKQGTLEEGFLPFTAFAGRRFDVKFINEFNRWFGTEGSKHLNIITDAAGILRVTKAAVDLSPMAIQGLPSFGLALSLETKATGKWFEAWCIMTRAFFDTQWWGRYMAAHQDSVFKRIMCTGSSSSIDFFQVLSARQGLGGKFTGMTLKIPGTPYQRGETAFYAASEFMRNEFWEIMSPAAFAKGHEFELAKFLDRLTGIVDSKAIGITPLRRQIEQAALWFAARYTRACLMLLANCFRGGYTGAMARRALGGMIAGGSVMYTGLQFSISLMSGKSAEEAWSDVEQGFGVVRDPISGEVDWSPSGRFMSLRVGNYNLGIGGFWYGLVRLAGNINACVESQGAKEPIDLIKIIKYGGLNRDNPFIYWWYTRASPLFGSIYQLATHADFMGEPLETPFEYARYIGTLFEPIWMEQGINPHIPHMARDYEVPRGFAKWLVPVMELFGFRTFPDSLWVEFEDMANEKIQSLPESFFEGEDSRVIEAWKAGKLTWDYIPAGMDVKLLDLYPDLLESYQKAQLAGFGHWSGRMRSLMGELEANDTQRLESISLLSEGLRTGELRGEPFDNKLFRTKCGDIMTNHAVLTRSIRANPDYGEIFEYFDTLDPKGTEYGLQFPLALAWWETNILFAEDLYDPEVDWYDWDERDRRIQEFKELFGASAYNKILDHQENYLKAKGYDPLYIKLATDKAQLQDYWDLPTKKIKSMGERDQWLGKIPDEYLPLWEELQGLETLEEKEAFIDQHPELDTDYRVEYLLKNPNIDAILLFWGYRTIPSSGEALGTALKWADELGIGEEGMTRAMRLPPEEQRPRYYEWLSIRGEFGAGSPHGKLFLLENAEEGGFLEWKLEALGGKSPDERVEVLRLRVKFWDEEQEYKAIKPNEFRTPDEAEAERKTYLIGHKEFARSLVLIDCWNDGFGDYAEMHDLNKEDFVTSYMEYYYMPKGDTWKDERYLVEHPDLYKAFFVCPFKNPRWSSAIDIIKDNMTPSEELERLYKQYHGEDDRNIKLNLRHRNDDLDKLLLYLGEVKVPIGKRGSGKVTEPGDIPLPSL